MKKLFLFIVICFSLLCCSNMCYATHYFSIYKIEDGSTLLYVDLDSYRLTEDKKFAFVTCYYTNVNDGLFMGMPYDYIEFEYSTQLKGFSKGIGYIKKLKVYNDDKVVYSGLAGFEPVKESMQELHKWVSYNLYYIKSNGYDFNNYPKETLYVTDYN